MVGLLFGRTGELGAHHDRDIELLGHDLEAPGDFRDLLHPVVDPSRGFHQLQIVDHNEIHTAQAAQPRLHLRDGDAGRVIQKNRRFAQDAGGKRNPSPLVRRQVAHPQLFTGDARLGREQAVDHLLPGHLQVEDRNRTMLLDRDVARDIQSEACLSHAGAGSHNDEVGFVEPGRDLVEGADPRRDPDKLIALIGGELIEHFIVAREHLLDRDQAAGLLALPDIVNPLLRRVQKHGRFGSRIHRLIHNLPGRFDQGADIAFFPDDAGIMRDIGNGRDNLGKPQQIGLPFLTGKKRLRFESLENRDEVDELGFHELRGHDPENRLVFGQIKMFRTQHVRHLVDAVRLHENGAEHRLLGLQAVREIEFVIGIVRHGYSPYAASSALFLIR